MSFREWRLEHSKFKFIHGFFPYAKILIVTFIHRYECAKTKACFVLFLERCIFNK